MDIYSKELATEQENYIYLLNNDADDLSLIKLAESRLLLLGFSQEQLKELKIKKKSFQSVTIYSPYSGHLHDLINSKTINNMSAMSESSTSEFKVSEGMYVKKGQTIFNIYNTVKVWAILNIYHNESDVIKTGQKVILSLDSQGSLIIEGKIDFIEPYISGGQNTLRVRVYLNNKNDELKIGTLVNAKIEAGSAKGIFIPASALIHLGNRDIVFVKEKTIFKSIPVQYGITIGSQTMILKGLSNKDEIAENAQLLIDSESFIKTENQSYE